MKKSHKKNNCLISQDIVCNPCGIDDGFLIDIKILSTAVIFLLFQKQPLSTSLTVVTYEGPKYISVPTCESLQYSVSDW